MRIPIRLKLQFKDGHFETLSLIEANKVMGNVLNVWSIELYTSQSTGKVTLIETQLAWF